jgi:glycosyltransferase involved in cell wall biosynthesis
MLRVAFVVNGEPPSAMGHRARAFAERLDSRYDLRLFYRSGRKVAAVARLLAALLDFRPQVCYVFDIAYSGVAAAGLYKHLTGARLVIDTGDAVTELARALDRGPLGVGLTHCLEKYALAVADRVVVRGTYHRAWLARKGVHAAVIQDGVETDLFAPPPVADLRRQLGLEGVLTVGLVGSSMWSRKFGIGYGWDLVELVRLLRDRPVAGVMVGGGSGIPILRERCRQYGIEGRVRFLGPVPYAELPRYLALMDVCLSTQTNDLTGRVRTTGKLPLYLASGRYVLASRVGEAALVLGEEMLVEYRGTVDEGYPGRLAGRVVRVLEDPALLERGRAHAALARARFDYTMLAEKVHGVIQSAAGGHANGRGGPRGHRPEVLTEGLS